MIHVCDGIAGHVSEIGVGGELAVAVVVSRRKGDDPGDQAHQVLGLAGEHDGAALQIAVKQRTDADGIAGGDELVLFAIVEDQRKFSVQHAEHLHAVFVVEGQQDLAVGFALQSVFVHHARANRAKAVDFAVAHHGVFAHDEGLHARLVEAHDGQAVEAEIAGLGFQNAAHVRAAGDGPVKVGLKNLGRDGLVLKTHDGTHKKHLRIFCSGDLSQNYRTNCCISVVPPTLLLKQSLCWKPSGEGFHRL